MDSLREVAPFAVGLILPPIIMIAFASGWSSGAKFSLAFATSLVVGISTSFFAGELAAGFPVAFIAVLVDMSLVFTGTQLAYHAFWKPALQPHTSDEPASERVPARRRR